MMQTHCPSRRTALSSAVALALAAPVLSGPALAQDEAMEEITVTGSRIVRRDFTSSSPIVTIGAETFAQTSSIALESALNQLPQFVPAQTMFSAGDVQPSAFNNPGIVTLNLRGIGANRNLVLIDGRRAQPANAQLVVDINTIPAAAVESVEIISGGASAVYGADAMGGVTNFKLKKNFEGFNLTVQSSGTEQGGGRETSISVLVGAGFGGSGNAMLGITYSDREALYAREREFYVNGWRNANTAGGEGLPFSNIEFAANNPPSPDAYAAIFGAGMADPGEEVYVNPDGTLFLNSARVGAVGYTGPLNDEFFLLGPGTATPGVVSANNMNQIITTPLERYALFGRASYNVTDSLSAFVQVHMSQQHVDTVLNYAPATSQWSATIPVDGRPIPPQLQALLESREDPTAPYTLSRNLDFAGPRRTENTTDMYQVMAGVEGRIGSTDWRYEAYISHGRTALVTEMKGFPGLQNYREIVTAPNFGKDYYRTSGPPLFFEVKCTTGLPIFEYFTPSQDCLDSIATNMRHLTETEQDIIEVNFMGDVFDLPAGTVGAAFGASTRENTFTWNPDHQLTRASTNFPIGLFPSAQSEGKTDVKEIYGELLLPLLANKRGARRLDLEIGARYSDYNMAGEIWTYKGLIDWAPTESIRFRGGYQLANRAPNVAELFTGKTTSVVFFPGGDPCLANTGNTTWGNHPNNPNRAQVIELCSELINRSTGGNNDSPWHTSPLFPDAIVGPFPFLFQFELANITGNPNLRNEEAETWTWGVVLDSPFSGILQNATLAIDWYQIKITDAIAPTNAWSVYAKCLNEDGGNPNYEFNEYCALISRDQDGYRATVDTPYFNLGGIETAGVDVQLNWGIQLKRGFLNITSVVNVLDYYRDQTSPTDPFVESSGTFRSGGQFDYRVYNTASYGRGNWNVGVRHRYLPSIEAADYATNPQTPVQGAGSYQMFDAFGSVSLSDKVTLRGGIDNLFDIDPEIVGRNPGVTDAAGVTMPAYYDALGRRYYMSLDVSF